MNRIAPPTPLENDTFPIDRREAERRANPPSDVLALGAMLDSYQAGAPFPTYAELRAVCASGSIANPPAEALREMVAAMNAETRSLAQQVAALASKLRQIVDMAETGEHGIGKVAAEAVEGIRNAALRAAPAVTDQQTDLSKRLRNIASEDTSPYFCTNVPKDDLRAAADEIERYYGGMLAWKQSAEKKDRDWNEARMGRENDRIAAPASHRDASLAALLTRIEDAAEAYERYGAICQFEGSPMIYAETLIEIVTLRGEYHVSTIDAALVGQQNKGDGA